MLSESVVNTFDQVALDLVADEPVDETVGRDDASLSDFGDGRALFLCCARFGEVL